MSSFTLSNRHIDQLVVAAFYLRSPCEHRGEINLYYKNRRFKISDHKNNCNKIGKFLLKTNINISEPNLSEEQVKKELDKYKFRGDQIIKDMFINKKLDTEYMKQLAPHNRSEYLEKKALFCIQTLKNCDCYEYQTGYKYSFANSLIKFIRNTAITSLPGYDDAEWAMEEYKELDGNIDEVEALIKKIINE